MHGTLNYPDVGLLFFAPSKNETLPVCGSAGIVGADEDEANRNQRSTPA
ncbi:MAG: hypothetical protein OXI18_06625 [bacterium]|nr:hypothetical protein [bacterium]